MKGEGRFRDKWFRSFFGMYAFLIVLVLVVVLVLGHGSLARAFAGTEDRGKTEEAA
jgi:hypothetical protein